MGPPSFPRRQVMQAGNGEERKVCRPPTAPRCCRLPSFPMPLQGDGFAVFSREGRDEPREVEAEVVPRILIGNAGTKSPEQLGQSGTKKRKKGKSIGNSSVNINSFKITSYTSLMKIGITGTLRCRIN